MSATVQGGMSENEGLCTGPRMQKLSQQKHYGERLKMRLIRSECDLHDDRTSW